MKVAYVRRVGTQYAVGVVRTVAVDVFDRRPHVLHDAHREDQIEIFRKIIVLGRNFSLRDVPAHRFIAAQFDAVFPHGLRKARQELRRRVTVDEQRLQRVAHSGTLTLGVDDDLQRPVEVRDAVHEEVADPLVVLEHRHGRLARDHADQILAAARNHEVDVLIQLEHQFYRLARGPRQKLDRSVGESRLHRRVVQKPCDGAVAVEGVAPAAQYHRVARLERDPRRVRGHVGTRFVDDPHHAEGHGDLAYSKSVGAYALVEHPPDGIVLGRDGAKSVDHAVDPGVGQREPVELRRGQTGSLRLFEVRPIGFLKFGAGRVEAVRHQIERLDLGLRRDSSERGRGRAGALADPEKFLPHGFQLAIHIDT